MGDKLHNKMTETDSANQVHLLQVSQPMVTTMSIKERPKALDFYKFLVSNMNLILIQPTGRHRLMYA